MDPIARLTGEFRDPAVLGLDTPEALSAAVRAAVARAATEGRSEEQVYQAALADLLGLELRALRRQPEQFSAGGRVSVTQGAAARLADLRADIAAALRAAGNPDGTPLRRPTRSGGWTPL